jgi:hypothetical protein
MCVSDTHKLFDVTQIQPSQRHRYAIWPSVGIVDPRFSVSVLIVLLEHAKADLVHSFEKLGPLAEFRQRDKFTIEWCEAPDGLFGQLCGDENQDHEILSSFWNHQHTTEYPIPHQHQPLRVRFSVNDKPTDLHPSIAPCVSMDTSHESEGPKSKEGALLKEVDNIRRQCEELKVERLILENELEEGRQEKRESRGAGALHKFRLQQTLRCGRCYQMYSKSPQSPAAPIVSQACGHTVCRSCVNRGNGMFHCDGRGAACPFCHVPNAFDEELHVNHSLCAVISLLDI